MFVQHVFSERRPPESYLDPLPEHGYPVVAPQAFNLHLQADDADRWFHRAVAARCSVVVPADFSPSARQERRRDPRHSDESNRRGPALVVLALVAVVALRLI